MGQVEADHVDGAAGVGGVGEEAGTFACAEGAEALGDDLGVAERAGLPGLVVSDKVGAQAPAGTAA